MMNIQQGPRLYASLSNPGQRIKAAFVADQLTILLALHNKAMSQPSCSPPHLYPLFLGKSFHGGSREIHPYTSEHPLINVTALRHLCFVFNSYPCIHSLKWNNIQIHQLCAFIRQ